MENNTKFTINIQKVIEYYKENDRPPTSNTYLGKWLANQNYFYKKGKMPLNHVQQFRDFLEECPIIKGYSRKPNGSYVVEKFHRGKVLRTICFTQDDAKKTYSEINQLIAGRKPEDVERIFIQYAAEHRNSSFTIRI